MFQISLISRLCYPYSLFMSFVTNVTDICRRHVVILTLGETRSLFSLFSCQNHPYTIYPCSRYTHLVMLSSSTSIFSGVIAFCHF
jgi:hypothetical protein